MERYNIESEQVSSVCWIEKRRCKNGEWVKYSDHEAERKDLYKTIDSNSKKIIKLIEQNREMLSMLKSFLQHSFIKGWSNLESEVIGLIEKVEGEQNG